MPKPTTDSPIMNVAQAAKFLGTGKDLLYELAARDEIPHCHVGRYLRFHQADLEDYIRNSHQHVRPPVDGTIRSLRDRIALASRPKKGREVIPHASRGGR